jgi:glycosyltransferase involved in cell wall biosynthesis
MIAPMPFFEDRGASVRVLEESQGLVTLGHKVTVVSYHLGRDVPGIEIHRIPRVPWYQRRHAGPNWHKVYLDAMLFFEALKILRSSSFDLVHAHLHEGLVIANTLRKFGINLPILFDAQGSLTGEMHAHGFIRGSGFRTTMWTLIERQISTSAKMIVTSSKALQETLVKHFSIAPERVFHLSDGVNTDLFNPDRHSRNRVRERYGLTGPVIVYAGLLNRYQGIDFLIEDVAPRISRQIGDVKFLIVGFPDQEYRRRVRTLHLHDSFIFLGKIRYTELPQYLAAADVAVAPKFMISGEANQKVLAYMAMGLPTVALDYAYNREILNGAGIISRPERFADDVVRLLRNAKLRARLAKDAREIAERKYSWRSAASELAGVYSNLLAQSPP